MRVHPSALKPKRPCSYPGCPKLVDGQYCEGCHNQSTWDKDCGTLIGVDDLVQELLGRVSNKKVTISGGEPFFQAAATIELVAKLYKLGFDICLYTGSEFLEVKRDFSEILPYLHYIKAGKYKQLLRSTTTPYVGSTNQKFLTRDKGAIQNEFFIACNKRRIDLWQVFKYR